MARDGGVRDWWNYQDVLVSDGTAKLEIDARALACAGGAKDITLLQLRKSGNGDIDLALRAQLDALADNTVWVSGKVGTVAIEEGANAWWPFWSIVADIDNISGTTILLR